MQGTLGACSHHPNLMHHDVIYDVELIDVWCQAKKWKNK
jgi:hypothetical protein